MVVQKKQVKIEIDKEIKERVISATVIIDERLIVSRGDTVVVHIEDLGITHDLGHAMYHEILGDLIDIYREAGWDVGYSDNMGETSRFTFD